MSRPTETEQATEKAPSAWMVEARREGGAWTPFMQRPYWNRPNAEHYANEASATNEGAGLEFRTVPLYRGPTQQTREQPVAWMVEHPSGSMDVLFNAESADHVASRKRGTVTPLYTRPAPPAAGDDILAKLADFLDFEERWCLDTFKQTKTDRPFYDGRLSLIRNIRLHMSLPSPPRMEDETPFSLDSEYEETTDGSR